MSHPRPWEEFESDGIQFGEVAWHTTATAESKRRVDWQIEETPLHFANGEIPSHRDRQVVIEQHAWETMRRHALEDPHHETGGLLLGYPFAWSEPTSSGKGIQQRGGIDTGLWICQVLPGKHLDSTPTRLTFTYETWQQWGVERASLPSQWGIVGWYHTHPGWGVFLSEWDQFLSRHYFAEPKQVAIVIDPLRDLVGCFEWDLGPMKPEACMVARRELHQGSFQNSEIARDSS